MNLRLPVASLGLAPSFTPDPRPDAVLSIYFGACCEEKEDGVSSGGCLPIQPVLSLRSPQFAPAFNRPRHLHSPPDVPKASRRDTQRTHSIALHPPTPFNYTPPDLSSIPRLAMSDSTSTQQATPADMAAPPGAGNAPKDQMPGHPSFRRCVVLGLLSSSPGPACAGAKCLLTCRCKTTSLTSV